MVDTTFYVKAFIALLVLVNPLEGMPIFLSGTENADPALKRRIERRAAVAITIILLLSLFLGNALLKIFGISIGAFQAGGGAILFLIAIQMILGAGGSSFANMNGDGITPEFAIVPLAIPIMAGPGAINGAVLYGTQAHSPLEMGILAGVIVLVGLTAFATLKGAVPIARYLKAPGISIATRIMGLFIAAIAVEMIARGVSSMFHLRVF